MFQFNDFIIMHCMRKDPRTLVFFDNQIGNEVANALEIRNAQIFVHRFVPLTQKGT